MGKIKAKKKTGGKLKQAIGKVKSAIGAKIKGTKGTTGRKGKHGAAWYARNIMKLKLKKKYEKAKLGMYR